MKKQKPVTEILRDGKPNYILVNSKGEIVEKFILRVTAEQWKGRLERIYMDNLKIIPIKKLSKEKNESKKS